MPTLLVTNKMAPELARHVQASVSGRKRGAGRKSRSPSVVALLRVVTLTLLVAAVSGVVVLRQRDRDEVEALRAGLLETVAKAAATLTPEDRQTLPRVERALTRAAGGYEGDVVDASIRSKAGLSSLFERPLLYVRGSIEGFETPAAIAETARSSQKDAFLVCLLDPPATRSERALLDRVYVAHSSRARVDERTPNSLPLYDAEAGAPFLAPEFPARVRELSDRRRLKELAASVERAPLVQASQAAKARTLLFVMDEAADRRSPAELDGERARHVRVGIVDLASDRVLLRLRRFVDPAWISEKRRAEYASGLNACALSLDLRAQVAGDEPSPATSSHASGRAAQRD
jgi:hypothetical protein